MLERLNQYDHAFFGFIQRNCRSEFWDAFFVACRDKHTWVPLYVFLLASLFFKYGKRAWIIFIFSLILITLTDQINSSFVKSIFKRERPCREVYFHESYTPAISCSGGYSFPSSHATNHMGLAVFFVLIFGSGYPRYLLLFWAILVGYAQVYVGVHFPFDVLFGFLEGSLLGLLCFLIMQRFFLPSFSKHNVEQNTLL